MKNHFNEDYQYDSCVSRGICSINPRTSSLQVILVLYLRLISYYAKKMCDKNVFNRKARFLILQTISVMVSNPEFTERDFVSLIENFNSTLPDLKLEYEKLYSDDLSEELNEVLSYTKITDVISFIQLGEKEFLRQTKRLSQEARDLYKILFVLAKSICTNILDLETFEIDSKDGYFMILELLDSLNEASVNVDGIKEKIIKASKYDNELMQLLRQTQRKRYGNQIVTEVSYSTSPSKAVLVVGSNIRELEDVLEALKDTNIDVYTHDEMMLAHTFPKFAEYKNLKGQFGQGMESCLLDFATFPGPIILTRHSLYNVEHLYRGRLFTTDFALSKGVISIRNKDFSEIIKSAEESRGFKRGKQCETVNIGYNYEKILESIKEKFKHCEYSKIFIVGLNGYTLEQQAYFEKLLRQTPDDVLIISLSYCAQQDNLVCVNACFDSFAIIEFATGLQEELKLPITVFFPRCDRHTISQMVYLSSKDNIQIYVGKCAPIALNPSLMGTLNQHFSINSLSTVKKDLGNILGEEKK